MVRGVECLICFPKKFSMSLKKERGKKEGENKRQKGNFAKLGKKYIFLVRFILF